jgi:hypothetical protein
VDPSDPSNDPRNIATNVDVGATPTDLPRRPAIQATAIQLFVAGVRVPTKAFGLLAESPPCAGYQSSDEHRQRNADAWARANLVASSREGRTADAYEALVGPRLGEGVAGALDLDVWSWSRDVFAQAVEWYENRPSSGASAGERLFACISTFCRIAKARGWPGLPESDREAFERAAKLLIRHRL